MKNLNTQHIPQLLDYRDLEHHYNLKKSTMTKLSMWGRFCNIVKIGTKNYFRKEDVEAWIDAQTIKVVS